MNPARRAARTVRVLYTAAVIYLGYKWTGLRNRADPANAAARTSGQHLGSARRFLGMATSVRGLMIKAGQVMGARADLFPDEYVDVLSKLHDDLPPRPFREIRRVVDAELGRPLEQVFAEFEPKPVASASLAQVHRARLGDGRQVAVKVQYPDIEEIVKIDLRNIRLIARAANRLILREIDLKSFVAELEYAASQELDFVQEGHNAERMARDFRATPSIVVPSIAWEHTSRRLLVMNFVDGVKATDAVALKERGVTPTQVMDLVIDAYMRQILINGFFHGDPHPGNIFVQPGPRLVLLDFGLCKELSADFRRAHVQLTWAMVSGDRVAIGDALRAIGFETRDDDPSALERVGELFARRMSDPATPNRDLTRRMNTEMMAIVKANPVVRIPADFLLIGRVMGLISGLGAQLKVPLDVSQSMGIYAAQAQADLSRPAALPA
ncbi:MAG: hypothetical protein GEU28_03065 [Dehalococcoidia bacterium]|nr:hypothetical protein [Dehalococcoidia bacterium]